MRSHGVALCVRVSVCDVGIRLVSGKGRKQGSNCNMAKYSCQTVCNSGKTGGADGGGCWCHRAGYINSHSNLYGKTAFCTKSGK